MSRLRVFVVPYSGAREVLAEVIHEARAGDSLAPVTVIVPSHLAGLDTRRWLARRLALANVRFLVVERLAELLAAPALQAAGKRPRTRWQWLEHLRAAAERTRDERLKPLASHPATLRRLAALAAELRGFSRPVREQLAHHPDPLVAAAVTVVAEAEAAASNLYDDQELLDAAAEIMESRRRGADEAGLLVLYLPDRLPPAVARLVRAAGGQGGACAILGLTGDPEVDAEVDAWHRALTGDGGGPTTCEVTPTLPRRVAILPDPEEEVRYAIREVWRKAAAGVPLHRMAVLYGNAEQYAALVHDRLQASGTPHNGPGLRRLADSLAGRAILGALRAARRGWRRDSVIDWVTSAPIHDGNGEVPGHGWDLLSREAGVVRGIDHWKRAADVIEASLQPRVEEGQLTEDDLGERVAQAHRMAAFVEDAAARLAPTTKRPLSEWAGAAQGGLQLWLPRRAVTRLGGPDGWADMEAAAYGEVVRALEGIAALDPGSAVELATFEALLREALDAPAERHGKLGEGVFTGTVEEAAGMAFSFAVVLGLAERVFPVQPTDDPLLPDRVRREFGGAVPTASERVARARRAYLAVCAGTEECLVTAPRTSLRDQRPAQPSRWFLEAAASLHGGPVYVRDIDGWVAYRAPRPAWLEVVDSFAAWVQQGDVFGDVAERDLAEVIRAGGSPFEHPTLIELGVRDAMRARLERSRNAMAGVTPGLTPWTGEALPRADDAPELSASALETLTSCPFRFFLAHELGLRDVEKPEDLDVIDPATRGSLVHEVLERFVLEVKGLRGTPLIAGQWTEEERARLLKLAEEAFVEYEQRGLTGRPAAWTTTKQRLRQDFERFLAEDERQRNAEGLKIRDAELAFGSRAGREVAITLDSGRTVRFQGKADRVDVAEGGSLVVRDYKSGRKDPYELQGNQLRRKKGGWSLQLPIYALAARGSDEVKVAAAYWFISEEENFEQVEVQLDAGTEAQFRQVVDTALALRERGLYPAIPGKPDFGSWQNCRLCPFDRVCPGRDRDHLWARWKQDERLEAFVRVVVGDGEEDGDGVA